MFALKSSRLLKHKRACLVHLRAGSEPWLFIDYSYFFPDLSLVILMTIMIFMKVVIVPSCECCHSHDSFGIDSYFRLMIVSILLIVMIIKIVVKVKIVMKYVIEVVKIMILMILKIVRIVMIVKIILKVVKIMIEVIVVINMKVMIVLIREYCHSDNNLCHDSHDHDSHDHDRCWWSLMGPDGC